MFYFEMLTETYKKFIRLLKTGGTLTFLFLYHYIRFAFLFTQHFK